MMQIPFNLQIAGAFTAALVLQATAAPAEFPDHPLLRQAQMERAPRVAYARDQQARVELTSDHKSFHVLWLPKEASPSNPPPTIVTIHGHGSWAFDEFHLWHRAAQERGYGILAIQWWLGKGERFQDYLTPREIYRDIHETLQRENLGPERALFHGFSRGSANAYAVAAEDRRAQRHFFCLFIANAGKPGLDFPPNRNIEQGGEGTLPLKGTHWVTFAGGKDPHPERDGIAGMRAAGEWIRRYGGIVDRAIEDETADHGGFHRNPANLKIALDIFQERLKPPHPESDTP